MKNLLLMSPIAILGIVAGVCVVGLIIVFLILFANKKSNKNPKTTKIELEQILIENEPKEIRNINKFAKAQFLSDKEIEIYNVLLTSF